MADASYVRSSFLGGEWSKFSQGRTDKPDYPTALNLCLNGLPIETGAWVRRPGFQFAQTSRNGNPARVIKFDFQAVNPYTMSFTDGHVRFFNGATLSTTNDGVSVSSISNANPVVVALTAAVTWSTGDQGYFTGLDGGTPLLQNRVFILTKVDATHFSLADPITMAAIDGATLGPGSLASSARFNRVQDIASPYVGGSWGTVRNVQTDTTSFLLQATIKPYAVTITTQPSAGIFAQFALAPAVFLDGPYFDPVAGGTLVTPSGTTGNITLTLSFPAYDATTSYSIGDYVTSAAVNYKSLTDTNLNNLPPNATFWVPVSAADAINSGRGFLGTDLGRLVRLLDSAGKWTWGRITGLSNGISGTLAGSANIGGLTGGGGLAAAFDGVFLKTAATSAELVQAFGGIGQSTQQDVTYVGKDYSGATDQIIQQATVIPSTDGGLAFGYFDVASPGVGRVTFAATITINLRGKATLPANSADGTLLGTTGSISNTTSAVTVISSDQTTAWKYVWIEISVSWPYTLNSADSLRTIAVAQAVFYNPAGTGTGQGCVIQLVGPALATTGTISVWRLGLYSDTTGWPTAGTYHEGRLWLTASADPNRIDSSVSNGIFDNGRVNFAPTDVSGNVLASSGISYIFNAPDSNPIYWMEPDLQGIICGTNAGEWLIKAPTSGGITPTNIAAARVTKIGCANIEPRRTDHTIVMVQKFQRKIQEYFADVFSGKFSSPQITATWKHLTAGGVKELAYQQEFSPIVWARIDGGRLVGCTYSRDSLSSSQGPAFAGGHQHILGSGRVVESMSVGPSLGGALDALTVITNDPATGVRHVEVLTDILDEGTLLQNASYLDNAVTPSSAISSGSTPTPYGGMTLNGLWHLNGKTVTAWLGGLDCGDYAVANGSITVPYGDGVEAGTAGGQFTAAFVASFGGTMPMRVGFTYTSQGQTVRPATREESGARSGPAMGKKRRTMQASLLLEGSQGISVGTDFNKLDPVLFKFPNDVAYTQQQQFTGVQWVAALTDIYSYDSMIAWEVSRPYICNVMALGAFVQTMDK